MDARPTQVYEPNSAAAYSVTASLGQTAADGNNDSRLRQIDSSEQRGVQQEIQPRGVSTKNSVSRTVLNVSVRDEIGSNSASTTPVVLASASAKSQVLSGKNKNGSFRSIHSCISEVTRQIRGLLSSFWISCSRA